MGKKEVINRRGLAKKHAVLDYEIWQWKTSLENSRGKQRVTKNEVQAFALETYKIAGIPNFKASDGWYRRWRQRWQNSDTAVNNAVENGQNETAKVENEKAAIQDPSNKRRGSEVEFLFAEGEIRNTKECDIKEAKKHFKDKPQLGGFQDTSDSSSINNTIESHLHSEGEARKLLGNVIKNTIPVELNPPTSGLDSLALSVNFVKVKQGKSPKRLKLNPIDIKLPLKTNSVCGFETSTELSDSRPETDICEKIDKKLAAGQWNEIGSNPVDFQKVTVVRPSEQRRAILVENEYINPDCIQKTLRLIETTEEENLWTFVNQEQGSVCLTDDSPVCSQADSGISIPTSGNLEVTDSFILSPIFQSSEIDFSENDHELFCDACEDFHPRQKCSHSSCKQKKEARSSFLLSCVIEKKESKPVADLSHVNVKCVRDIPSNTSDTSVTQLKNPSVIAPKGKRYLVQFKSKVVNYALNHSVKLAAEKFKVNRNTVAEWLTERNILSANVPVKHVDKNVAGDSEFLAWLEDSKFNLTNELVKQRALEWLQINEHNSSRQSRWLRMYAHRLNGTDGVAVKKHYIVYPEAFKRAVVFHAQTHSNMAASRVFSVARKRIIEWQQHAGDAKKTSKNTNANNVTDEAVDVQVYEWFCQQQPTPTSRQVRNKAVELYRAAGHNAIQCKSQWYYRWRARHNLPPSREQRCADMIPLLVWALSQLDNNKCVSQSSLAAQAATLGYEKVSRGWTLRFCKKYSALLQALPAPDTPLPSVLECHVREYKQKLHDVISTRGVTDDRIIALDEIPLHFLPKENVQYNHNRFCHPKFYYVVDKAKKPLLVRRPGFESCQATLMLSCLADGTLLPTIFVFKGSGPDVGSPSDPQVIAVVNDSGRISDDTMHKWLSAVCFPHLSGEGVIVLDSFDVHTTPEVSHSTMSHNIDIAVTPAGCAFRLLPLTPFCHTFKAMLEEMCQMWLSRLSAVLESPSPEQLYQWAVRAHKHMAKHYKEKIQIAFKNMLLHQSCQNTSS